ncbi:MAG: hypothetical protein QM811_00450 [Pirellulales bacterium]
MSLWSKFKRAWLVHVAKPTGDTFVKRTICARPASRILEIGVGDASRALTLIGEMRDMKVDPIHYYGIDEFEGRTLSGKEPGLAYKDAFRKLKASGAQVQLIPGDPFTALSRTANTLRDMQLVVISADQFGDSLDRGWFYLPRVLAPDATILVADGSQESGFRTLTPLDVQRLVEPRPRKKAA